MEDITNTTRRTMRTKDNTAMSVTNTTQWEEEIELRQQPALTGCLAL